MSPAMKNPAKHAPGEEVAGPPPAPYTATVIGERNGGRGAWWRDGLRSWIPMLAIGVTLLISIQSQMLGMQRQIGDLQGEMGDLRAEFRDVIRAEVRTALAAFRKDVEGQIGWLREDFGELREDVGELHEEVGELREDVGELRAEVMALGDRVQAVEERMTSLETVVETHLRQHARPGASAEGAAERSSADRAD